MKYYLSNSSLLRKRDWMFVHWQTRGESIKNKNIVEMVKLAALAIRKNDMDYMVAKCGNSRIFIDGYLNKRGEPVVWVTLSTTCKKPKNSREYVIGLYGGAVVEIAQYEGIKGKEFYSHSLKKKVLGCKYPLC